jgi:hypothetical protein
MHGNPSTFYPLTEMAYYSPQHFSCVYLGANTLTLTGLPFTPASNSQFTELRVMTVGGATTVYPSASYNFSYNSGTGVLTVIGGNFLATDLSYRLVIIGEARAYSAAGNYLNQSEVSPINQMFLEEVLFDSTNSPAAEWPSADGLLCGGFQHFALNGTMIEADATLTLQVLGTIDNNVTPASRTWVPLYGYSHGSNSYTNIITCASTTVTFMWDFDYANYKYIKVVLTTTDPGPHDNTVKVFCRRAY